MISDDPTLKALELLLRSFNHAAPPTFQDKIKEYEELVSTWNEYASLMSSSDVSTAFSDHVADSLSLVPYIYPLTEMGHVYLDVGSGGGLPAIPIKLFAPGIPTTLIERNARKAAFIRKTISRLNLTGIEVLEISFSASLAPARPFVLTARAIEKPYIFLQEVAKILEHPSVFLRQTGPSPPSLPPAWEETPIDDVFDSENLRRGRLCKVTIKKTS